MLFALCFSAEAQQPKKIPRIGFLVLLPFHCPSPHRGLPSGSARARLRGRKNIVIEYRYAEGKIERLGELAAELVRLKLDVIVTAGPSSTRSVKEATATIPIVMALISILLGMGSSPALRDLAGHHWIVHPFPGDKRKTTGAFEGDRS